MNWVRVWSLVGLVTQLIPGVVAPALSQTAEPILRVEVGTHTAAVFAMAMDASSRILITGSEDKSVRVWDITGKGELLRILRPPVSEGETGQVFAVALSPDTKTVACGGRTGAPRRGDGCVYLFDRSTGSLTQRLGGLPGWVQHLTYTPDGRFLAVVTGEGGGNPKWSSMTIYRLPDYSLVAEDRDFSDCVKWVESNPAGSQLATTCLDGFVRLYELSSLKTQDSSSPQLIKPAAKIRSPGGDRPDGLAFSPDGIHLAVGFNLSPKVNVLRVKGNALEYEYSPDVTGVRGGPGTDLRTVAWSPDGKFLFAAGGYGRKQEGKRVRKWAGAGRGNYSDIPAGVNLPLLQILPHKAGGIVFGSREGAFGVINDRDEAILLGPRSIAIYESIHDGFLLSQDGVGIQFAFERFGKSPAIFSANERLLLDSSSRLWSSVKGSLALKAPITEGMGLSDWDTSLTPKLKGKPLHLKKELSKSLAIRPDQSGFFLGTMNSLSLFDAAGEDAWRVRTPGGVWGVNTNGKVTVAALTDGTIRWYRVPDGKEFLAFFPHKDQKRWILWTPSGYYDASPGGEDFIGWHVNNGNEQAADFFPASRFRSTYYRPDVIDRVLSTMDEAEAVRLANEESGRSQGTLVSVRDKLPPVVAILSPADGAEISGSSVTIKYSARSQESLTSLRILVDGRPISAEGTDKPVKDGGELTLEIPPRDCEVSLIAQNRFAASEPATIRLRWKGSTAGEQFEIKPKLYVLAVGVSDYQDQNLRLLLAAKDAQDFCAAWDEQKGRLYRGVEVRTLADAEATKGNILDGLEWLQRQVTSKDVAVLFFAGHGINDPMGMFYFLPVDVDRENLKRTGISQFDITSTVSGIAGKVLVFMDACHSGNLMGTLKRRGEVVLSAVINEMASAENGAVVFSSTTGRQYALENTKWGNGAFTKGVVEGIRGKADYTTTGRITLNMLDLYVSERVKELTGGQQTPTTVKPPNVPDFPVVLLSK
jgi:WD40 repeat protein